MDENTIYKVSYETLYAFLGQHEDAVWRFNSYLLPLSTDIFIDDMEKHRNWQSDDIEDVLYVFASLEGVGECPDEYPVLSNPDDLFDCINFVSGGNKCLAFAYNLDDVCNGQYLEIYYAFVDEN